jgi:hypothetical protein
MPSNLCAVRTAAAPLKRLVNGWCYLLVFTFTGSDTTRTFARTFITPPRGL